MRKAFLETHFLGQDLAVLSPELRKDTAFIASWNRDDFSLHPFNQAERRVRIPIRDGYVIIERKWLQNAAFIEPQNPLLVSLYHSGLIAIEPSGGPLPRLYSAEEEIRIRELSDQHSALFPQHVLGLLSQEEDEQRKLIQQELKQLYREPEDYKEWRRRQRDGS